MITYQDGISISNTASLAEAVIIVRNSKEHPQNKVNQNELPQLKKRFTKNEECQDRGDLIYSQTRPSSEFCMFILCAI